MLWTCCTQYATNFRKLNSGHRTGKCQFSLKFQRRAMPKNVQTNHTIALTSNAGKILQGRLQQYVNWELPDVPAGFSKGRGTRDQIANIFWMIKKAGEFQKNITVQSVQFSRSVMSNCLWPHESQHTGPPCPSPTPGVYSNSCPWSWWCHLAISSSVMPFSSCR